MSHDSLGDRMKGYEFAARSTLTSRLPVIIRVDGKAFHTYTRGCARPFDRNLSDVMISTATKLCESIQGAQLAYTQSDEISVLVHSYKKFDSCAWYDNQVQKVASVAAGIASAHFTANSHRIWNQWSDEQITCERAYSAIRPAVFDARVFIVPEAEVCNYFLWRQQDATRNSVQMLARSLYSHKQCDNCNVIELKEMCAAKGQAWDDLETRWKRGVCIRRVTIPTVDAVRTAWGPDCEIPLFNQDREYVNSHLALEEE